MRTVVNFSLGVCIAVAILAFSGCTASTNPVATPAAPGMTLGPRVAVTSQSISPAGGSVAVTGGSSPLNGFSITVRPNSFASTKTFSVSYAPITAHTFGADFNPISPLISIECGGGRADSDMLVRIPAHVPAGDFAMGFYYDSTTGELEGLPVIEYDSTGVTLIARHFTDLVLSAVQLEKLKTLNVNSGFTPGQDDWEFPNYGSAVAPGGQCDGQSIAAMWYYIERKVRKGAPGLNKRFCMLPERWPSNPRGYRLSSAMQKSANFASYNAAIKSYDQWNAPDLLDFLAFAYTIDITQRPQLVNILAKDGVGGHAVIAYKISGTTMYLADPNWPGNTQRYTTLVGDKFSEYASGENAATSDEIYNRIFFIGVTSAVGWDHAAELWGKFDDGSVGLDLFTHCDILALGPNGSQVLSDTFRTTNANARFSYSSSAGTNMRVTILKDTNVVTPDVDGNIALDEGDNRISFFVEQKVQGNWMWNDWHQVIVVRDLSPYIDTILPPSAGPGAVVGIHGFNFGNMFKPSKVTFNGLDAVIINWNDTSISAIVPTSASSGNVTVAVGDSVSNKKHFDVISGLLADMHKMTGLSVQFSADNTYSDGIPRSPYFSIPAGDPTTKIVWSGDTSFTLNGTYNGPNDYVTTITCSGAVSADGKALAKLEAQVTIGPKSGQTGNKETLHLIFTDLHETSTTTDGQGTSGINYQYYGAQSQSHVTTVSDRIDMSDGTVVNYVSTNWASTDTPAQPYVTISR